VRAFVLPGILALRVDSPGPAPCSHYSPTSIHTTDQ